MAFHLAMSGQLRSLERATKRYGRQLPARAAIQLFSMIDAMRDVVEPNSVAPMSTDERVALEFMVRDYIPSTVKAFLASKANQGQKERLLVDQLAILALRVNTTIIAVRAHDSAQLEINGRFLREKFG